MSLSKRIIIFVMVAVCMAGCGPEQQQEPSAIQESIKQAETVDQAEAVDLSLKYEPNDVATYKIVTKDEKSINFEGEPSDGVTFENARNYEETEIIFDQKISRFNDTSITVAKITIKELRYQKTYKNQQIIDYDSNNEQQKDHPFSKLVGQSYFIGFSPTGEVAKIISTSQIKRAAAGRSQAHQIALSLIEVDEIKRRHNIKGLSGSNKTNVHIGQQWSEIEDVSFDMMGSKSYEKIYTLEEISESQGRKMAVIGMDTIPTTGNAEQRYKKDDDSGLTTMFDSSDSFSGETVVDLSNGRAERCTERLQSQWTVINPSGEQGKEPSALTMTSVRSYSLERIE